MKRFFLSLAVVALSVAAFAQKYAYVKVTEEPNDWTGEYLIVHELEGEDSVLVFDGKLTELDAKNNCVKVAVDTLKHCVAFSDEISLMAFNVAVFADTAYSVCTKDSIYFGYNKLETDTTKLNNLKCGTENKYPVKLSLDDDANVELLSKCGYVLRYNDDPKHNRFRFHAPGKKTPIQLYRKVEVPTAISDEKAVSAEPIDGSLYFLPKGYYIVNGRLVYRAQ